MSKVGEQVRRVWGVDAGRGRESSPTSFEAVTRERADQLTKAVDRIEVKLNGMIVAVVAAVLAEIYRAATR